MSWVYEKVQVGADMYYYLVGYTNPEGGIPTWVERYEIASMARSAVNYLNGGRGDYFSTGDMRDL